VGSSPIASTTKIAVQKVFWPTSFGPPALNVSDDVRNAGDLPRTGTNIHGR
jgi:hypothetical protein